LKVPLLRIRRVLHIQNNSAFAIIIPRSSQLRKSKEP
jgi:hypothetical protein